MAVDLEWNMESRDAFWRFVNERMEIFWRRHVELKSPPWTNDPVLKKHKFTQVYRELDRGTLFLEHVTKGRRDDDAMVRVLVYRVLNNMEAYESLEEHVQNAGWVFSIAPVGEFVVWATNRMDRGKGCFNAAHLPPMVKFRPAEDNKTTAIMKQTVGYILSHKLNLFEEMGKTRNLEKLFDMFLEIPGIGPFYAYEFATDMAHLGFVKHSLDEWASIGPGCDRGLRQLVKSGSKYEAMVWLHQNQESEFTRLGIKFRQWNNRLSLRNIEHSLCEFQKYTRAQKTDWSRRQFRPSSVPLPLPTKEVV